MSIHMNDNLAEHRILGSPPSSAKPLEMAVLCWSEIWGERIFLLCRYPALLLRCWQDFLCPVFYILLFYPLQYPATLGAQGPVRRWDTLWRMREMLIQAPCQECWGNRFSIVISQTTPNISSKYKSLTLIFLPQTKLYYTSIGFLQVWDWGNNKVRLEKNFPSQILSPPGPCLSDRCHCSHRWPTSLLWLLQPLAESGRFWVP